RTDLSGDPDFQELLSREKEVALGAYAHQDLPFERLVEELQPQRSLSHSPLFQVLFIFQQSLREALELREIAATPLDTETSTAKFDLTLSLEEAEASLIASFEYNSDLFDAETIRRMAGHFRTLLNGIVSDPTQPISRLPLLTESETNQVLWDWNDTGRQYHSSYSIHELIEAQAGSRPEATAVECDGKYLSYGELNGQANQLAHYLRRLGVGPEQRVGVCMQRSTEMVVALLGILKAGAAYVPLDAAYPQLRLKHMVADSGARILLVDEAGGEKLSGTEANVVILTKHWRLISGESRENIESGVCGDNLAYVTYTSGSTGTPKGVAVRHASVVTLIHWAMEFFTGDELRVVLASTSISFDISVIELFLTLSVGGKIIIVEDALHLRTLQSAEEITFINTVPSAVAELVRTSSIPAGVQTVCLAGEALQGRIAQQVYAQQNISRVVNCYGPSEDTVYSTSFSIVRGAEGEPAIGRPIANTQVYILDQWLQPVAVGVAGEIFIAGAGLARGYLNKADTTAERFIPDPFSKDGGGRIYGSGDVGRYLADGNIQFIGRKDQQVKLRGFRIELGEIEAALTAHPLVSEAVVELRDSAKGDKYLVGYVAGAEQLTASEIREHLKKRLPEYMAPSRYVVLDHLPLSANGKLDRRALREMAEVLAGTQVEAQRAKRLGAVEEIVAGICSQVLGLDELDAEANFFELGGHSLLAAQVVSRVREAFNIDMGVRSVFENSTARGMAGVVERMLAAGRTNLDLPIRAVNKGERREMSWAQQRLWFLNQLEPGNSAYNIAAAIRLKGALDVAALERSLKEIHSRHEVLRTRYIEDHGLPVQELQKAETIELWTIRVEDLPAEERERYVRRVVDEEANKGFDLSKGELMRAGLIEIAEDEHILTLVMHHIISDGWSMGVLVRELSALYNAYCAGEQSPLEPLPIQYSDYVLWQREWLSGAVLDEQLSYWKERLHAMPELLELPTDRLRPAVQSFKGGRLTEDLGYELSHALKQVARAEGVTMFMLLIAAFKVLLYRYTGQEDISIGVPVANRSRKELEALIGLFVNTLVLRTDLSGDPDFQELLSREKEVALGAYAHQDLP
ncbi:MAG TPA: amino acid adenylation domain-containing protein, partial [Pyrinomonadaceae bacterium]|nr:amino acid adenylation domain-containing protein [Pyrinomonadaceae bacterium]